MDRSRSQVRRVMMACVAVQRGKEGEDLIDT